MKIRGILLSVSCREYSVFLLITWGPDAFSKNYLNMYRPGNSKKFFTPEEDLLILPFLQVHPGAPALSPVDRLPGDIRERHLRIFPR